MRHSHGRPMHQIIADVEAKNKSEHSVKLPVSSSSENPYPKAWERYQSSEDYKRAINAMSQKGMVQPYIDNILRGSFDAGYSSKS